MEGVGQGSTCGGSGVGSVCVEGVGQGVYDWREWGRGAHVEEGVGQGGECVCVEGGGRECACGRRGQGVCV